MIEESLYEFAKRGRPRKGAKRIPKNIPGNIDATDTWGAEEDEEMIDPDELDVDVSDMVGAESIDVEENAFDDELFKALSTEIKLLEPSRRVLKFKLKGDLAKTLHGIPMAKLGSNAFLFKLKDGSMKKIYLKDMIVESANRKNRAKMVNEMWQEEDGDDEYNEDYCPECGELLNKQGYCPQCDDND